MIPRARHWLPLFPLLALLGLAYWLNQQALTDRFTPEKRVRHDPDVIVENFSAVSLDTSGSPHFVISADRMQHFPDDDSTLLNAPRITMYSTNHQAINATALTGAISGKGQEVTLLDGVELSREGNTQQNPFRIHTEYLHILPDQDWVDTDRAITMIDANITLHAVGMTLDNKSRILKLLSQVRSEYVPNEN